MEVVKTFGNIVGQAALDRPDIARSLLTFGYRVQELKYRVMPDRRLPSSAQYVAAEVMQSIIDVLEEPENSVLTSVFVPGELFSASGLKPYSLEMFSGLMTGTKCEQPFLAQADREGYPETMCSFHRIYIGTSMTGMLPHPSCMMYTNLACDGNMMTFPYLREKYDIPGFYIDVPYQKNEESVKYVAKQLREARTFLEDSTGRLITDEALRAAVHRSNEAADYYSRQLELRSTRNPATTMTTELWSLFMCMIYAGSEESLEYMRRLYNDVKNTPENTEDLGIVWMHIMPFSQPPVKEVFDYSDKVHIKTTDFLYSGLVEMDEEKPFDALASKLVYSVYNGSLKDRIKRTIEVVEETNSDGVVLFAHWGCKSTIGASTLIKREIEAAGIPVLVLDGDAGNPANTSDGQVSTRLGAFTEMLRERKGVRVS